MSNKIELKYTITPTWEVTRVIRTTTNEIFKTKNMRLKSATITVVSELIENTVKYGKAIPEIGGIGFDFVADDKKIVVKVSNMMTSEEHFSQLKKHIETIKNCDNLEKLYMDRLKEILEYRNLHEDAPLGLYRIACEAKFNLSYELENGILTVIAQRDIPLKENA